MKKTAENAATKTADSSGKRIIEVPTKNIVENNSKNTQTDITTTSHQIEPISD